EARQGVAEASARNMAEIVKYAKLTTLYAGVVIERNVNLGDLVQSSASGSKGEAIFLVHRIGPVRVFGDWPVHDAGRVVSGKAKAAVRIQALKGEVFEGVVSRSSWSLDAKGRILRAQIDLPNPDGRFRPGMYASAVFSIVHKDAWAVPESALATIDG